MIEVVARVFFAAFAVFCAILAVSNDPGNPAIAASWGTACVVSIAGFIIVGPIGRWTARYARNKLTNR